MPKRQNGLALYNNFVYDGNGRLKSFATTLYNSQGNTLNALTGTWSYSYTGAPFNRLESEQFTPTAGNGFADSNVYDYGEPTGDGNATTFKGSQLPEQTYYNTDNQLVYYYGGRTFDGNGNPLDYDWNYGGNSLAMIGMIICAATQIISATVPASPPAIPPPACVPGKPMAVA